MDYLLAIHVLLNNLVLSIVMVYVMRFIITNYHQVSVCVCISVGLLFLGEWITPNVTGDRPPPIVNFTLTSVTNNTAVFFGGLTILMETVTMFISLILPRHQW